MAEQHGGRADRAAHQFTAAVRAHAVQAGFDANGNAICTAAGVAVIGLVDGKYVLYFTSIDGTLNPPGSSGVSAYVIQFYLYQQ